MKKRLLMMLTSVAMIFCLCACGSESADNTQPKVDKDSISFPSIYKNSMEEDFDIEYLAGSNFTKTPKAVTLSNDDTTKKVTMYRYDNEEKVKMIDCGIVFDTDDGMPEKAVTYTKITIKWDDGTSDSFDCSMTFQPDVDYEDYINGMAEFKDDIYTASFDNEGDQEYELSKASKKQLDQLGLWYDLGITNDNETVFDIDYPDYDMMEMELYFERGGKTYILLVHYNKYSRLALN